MGRPGHRVFIDANRRCEIARDEIVFIAPRGHDGAQPWQFRQCDHVRFAVEHGLLGLQHHEQLVRTQHIDRFHAKRTLDVQGHAHFRRDDRREIQPQTPTLTTHAQRAGLASEVQALNWLLVDFKQNVSAGQRRVTTQWHLGGRGEPANVPTLPFTHHESGFGEVVFRGDLLHQLIGEPCIQSINHRRIATEGPITERIDLMKLKLHETSPL
ncbi:hypothetical protein D3C87_1272050 [compost metagenome]